MSSSYLESSYVDGAQDIDKFKEAIYQENSSQWLQYMYEGDIDTKIYAGDTNALSNYVATTYNYKRNLTNFNKTKPIINMVSGAQRKNRKTSVLVPQEPQDQIPADQLSAALLWTMHRADTFSLISQAFENTIITGINLLSTWLDYTKDPVNGEICSSVLPYNSFLIDPFFKKLDLSDCKYVWTRKWISKDQAKMLLPGRDKEIDSMQYSYDRDGKFPFQPENLNYQSQGHLLIYDELWYASSRKQKMLLDQNTGETHKWNGDDESLDRFLLSYPQVTKITQTIPTVKYAVSINDRTLVNGDNPGNIDRYPHTPFVCYFHPEIPSMPLRVMGMVRNLRDAQWSYSRRMRLNLDYLEAGIARGIKYQEGALVDPNDAFLEGMGRSLAIKKGHSLDQVQEMQPPQIPPSWFQEIEKLDSDMLKIANVSETLMGIDEDEKAGILNVLKQSAGLTGLQPIFDQLDQSQKLVAQLYIEYMQNNWEVGKFQRILNEEPHPVIKSKYFSKFDVQVIDGALTPTQQIMEFKQLYEMVQAGILPNSPEIIEVMMKTAPLQNKKDLIEATQKAAEQAAQQAQAQQQVAMQELEAKTNLANARAEADRGLGIERVSRVEENRAMAIANIEEAKKDSQMADLNKARALKELTDIDLGQIEKAISLLQVIQTMQAQENPETPSPNQETPTP